jgi:hypothetical protein
LGSLAAAGYHRVDDRHRIDALVLACAIWTHRATGKMWHAIYSWLDRAGRGQGVLLGPTLLALVLPLVALILNGQRGINYDSYDPSNLTGGQLASLQNIVEIFHADQFNDLRYYLWYPGTANTLIGVMALLILVTVVIAFASAAHEWANQAGAGPGAGSP